MRVVSSHIVDSYTAVWKQWSRCMSTGILSELDYEHVTNRYPQGCTIRIALVCCKPWVCTYTGMQACLRHCSCSSRMCEVQVLVGVPGNQMFFVVQTLADPDWGWKTTTCDSPRHVFVYTRCRFCTPSYIIRPLQKHTFRELTIQPSLLQKSTASKTVPMPLSWVG